MAAVTLPTVLRSRFRFAGDLVRAGEVTQVLIKYGLAAWLNNVEWQPFREMLKSHHGQLLTGQAFEVRVRLALIDLGPTFVKLGQMLSTREHLVGTALAAELTKLQDSTPPDAAEVAIGVVESDLGRPIGECFRHFERSALASASIGQVHRVRLKTGRRAIIKVQHPGIEGTVRRDLEILGYLAELAEKKETLRSFQPAALVREFTRTMLHELDFRHEMRNLQKFRRNFAADTTVEFPKPFPELTSGRVLTMEFIDGSPIADGKHLDKLGIDRQELAKRGANIFLRMIFRDGFYHADPHPGNVLVLPDGRIGVLDGGMAGRIDEAFRRQLEDLLLAASERDAEQVAEAAMWICGAPSDFDRAALRVALAECFEEYGQTAVGNINMSEALRRVMGIFQDHRLSLPGPLSMVVKCLILLEGTGRLLNPTFNLMELMRPWRKKILLRRLSPRAQINNAKRLYRRWERVADSAPKVLLETVERLEKGQFAIRLEHRHLRSAANRLVVGLFISSLLIASAILLALHVPPLAWGKSAFGMLGYAVAIVIGIHMLWVNRDKLVARRDRDWD